MTVSAKVTVMPYTFPAGNVKHTPADIIAVLCQPGYMSPDDFRPITGCAVVLAESGGDPLATGRAVWNPGAPTHKSIDLGLFQLNSYYHTVTGPFPPTVGPITVADCFDVQLSWAQTWKVITRGRPADGWDYNWSAWTAFRTGAYDQWLDEAVAGMRAYRTAMALPTGRF